MSTPKKIPTRRAKEYSHPANIVHDTVSAVLWCVIPFIHSTVANILKDITSVKIKYEEGFANVLGHIFTKPELMWTKADQNLVIPTGTYMQCNVTFEYIPTLIHRVQLMYWLLLTNVYLINSQNQ